MWANFEELNRRPKITVVSHNNMFPQKFITVYQGRSLRGNIIRNRYLQTLENKQRAKFSFLLFSDAP